MKLLVLFVFSLFCGMAHAEGEAPATTPKQFNGSWIGVEGYGDPNNAEGWRVYEEVKAQKKAYADAKKLNDVEASLANSFWTSVQIWVCNNAGYRKIKEYQSKATFKDYNLSNRAEMTPILEEAKKHLDRAIAIAEAANPTEPSQGELDNRMSARAMAEGNLLYVERCLGLKPWPKVKE